MHPLTLLFACLPVFALGAPSSHPNDDQSIYPGAIQVINIISIVNTTEKIDRVSLLSPPYRLLAFLCLLAPLQFVSSYYGN